MVSLQERKAADVSTNFSSLFFLVLHSYKQIPPPRAPNFFNFAKINAFLDSQSSLPRRSAAFLSPAHNNQSEEACLACRPPLFDWIPPSYSVWFRDSFLSRNDNTKMCLPAKKSCLLLFPESFVLQRSFYQVLW